LKPRTIKVNVRIIAASNRNLEEEICNGRFREDLFYRLNVFPITIPPLRQRTEDIPLLVHHFIAKFNKKMGKKIESISKETMKALQEYSWPGNVRELESVVERAVITSPGTSLQVLDRFDTFRKAGELAAEDVALASRTRPHSPGAQETGWRTRQNGAAGLLVSTCTLRARMRNTAFSGQYGTSTCMVTQDRLSHLTVLSNVTDAADGFPFTLTFFYFLRNQAPAYQFRRLLAQ
jgi:DNA-binding NtrC family response regulator